ncbi:TPA: DNA polymerase III subunit epsilon [Legionella pneumophila]|nr:DNA polymerase III subunit epsilon [Legionella pneumophila]
MNDKLLNSIINNPDYRVLRRIPNHYKRESYQDSKLFIATIIDLETMGMDAKSHEIIEIGLLSFLFSTGDGIVEVIDTYNELNDPHKLIPEEITKITGITNEDVKGKAIDWDKVHGMLKQSHLLICHNSRFDRNFLELQTPEQVGKLVEKRPFGCTLQDIDWRSRGYESSKLEYLNFKLGFFYEGHRAIVDCWATLNLLLQEKGAFEELKSNVKTKETLLCAENAAFDKKDLLKLRNYRWSDGTGALPKCWWSIIPNDQLSHEKAWLDEQIYCRTGASDSLRQMEITAFKRYSFRAEQV